MLLLILCLFIYFLNLTASHIRDKTFLCKMSAEQSLFIFFAIPIKFATQEKEMLLNILWIVLMLIVFEVMRKKTRTIFFLSFYSFLSVCTCAPRHHRFLVLHVMCLLPTNGRRCLLAAFRRSLIWLVPGRNTGEPSSPNEVEGKQKSLIQNCSYTQSSSHF